MELTQLKYFQALAQHRNFTQTSEAIAVSQSALSRSIAKLEQELNVRLFDRHGKETELTEAGERFLFHVDRVIRELEIAEQELKAEAEHKGAVRVSFLHSLGDTYLPQLLRSFHAKYPKIAIAMSQQNSAVLAEEIRDGKTDICLCSLLNEVDIAWMYLWSDELYVVVADDHPLAKKKSVNLQDIDGEPFITLKPAYSLRQQINQLLDLAESHPQVIFEGDEVHNLISLVAAHLGVSILPAVPFTEKMGVRYIPVSFPICRRSVGIAWNTRRPLSPAAIRFQQFTISYFQKKEEKE